MLSIVAPMPLVAAAKTHTNLEWCSLAKLALHRLIVVTFTMLCNSLKYIKIVIVERQAMYENGCQRELTV
jgi:hypothetical protein